MNNLVPIVGSRDDPHVREVAEQLRHRRCLVFDVEQLEAASFDVGPDEVTLRIDGESFDLRHPCRGWIRRLSPMAWEDGITIGSHEAVSKASWLTLLATVIRVPEIEWLTGLDALTSTENKVAQYRAARRVGIPVPRTCVTNDPQSPIFSNQALVAKPLGPGHFRAADGQWLTVFTDEFDRNNPADLRMLDGPPFILQEALIASAHFRVVTVGHEAWVFRLAAEGLPTDWREEPRAHRDWVQVDPGDVARLAIQLAAELGVRYSSQDWIESADEVSFVDLNPAGQWLFLPDPGASEVTRAIAGWLAE